MSFRTVRAILWQEILGFAPDLDEWSSGRWPRQMMKCCYSEHC